MFVSLRPASRFQTGINVNTSRFTDPHGFFIPGINDGERRQNGEVVSLRPASRFQTGINVNTSRFTDPHGFFIPGITTASAARTARFST